MAAALIAVMIALSLGHALPQLARNRRFGLLWTWRDAMLARLGGSAGERLSGVLLVVGVPVLVLAIVAGLLERWLFGLPGFALAVIVLFWCWGPRDLDRDIDALRQAGDLDAADRAARDLDAPAGADPAQLVPAIFRAALARWFGVLFWFLLLGPAGALLFRWVRLLVGAAPPRADSALGRLQLILEWPVAQLMTLALAVAANFDAVFQAWRDWHHARGRWWVGEIGFLDAAARVSVNCELAEQAEDAELSPVVDAVATPRHAALNDAQSLVWRILIVWLTLLALFVLAGYAH